MGETGSELRRLLRDMQPFLHEWPIVFCVVHPGDIENISFEPLGIFREDEGVTLIITAEEADKAGLAYTGQWAHITLRVYSPLDTVGFIAAVTSELARAGISVNPVSAFHHDHLFVPWEKRGEALRVLKEMSVQP